MRRCVVCLVLSGWFGMGGGGRQGGAAAADAAKERKRPKIEPATTVTARHGMHDKRRDGESVTLSPDGHMAAVTDSFGRVMLLDVMRGVAVRIWKGAHDTVSFHSTKKLRELYVLKNAVDILNVVSEFTIEIFCGLLSF